MRREWMKERQLKHGIDRLGWTGMGERKKKEIEEKGGQREKGKGSQKVAMIGRSAQKYLEWLSVSTKGGAQAQAQKDQTHHDQMHG